jgi:hypothetical protein
VTACRNPQESPGGQVVYPGAFSNYSLANKSEDLIVDQDLISGKKIVVVQGCFHYKTMSALKYSYFCYFYRKGRTKIQNLQICESGHDAN